MAQKASDIFNFDTGGAKLWPVTCPEELWKERRCHDWCTIMRRFPPSPVITRVELMRGACPCCARRFRAAAPASMPPGWPYVPELTALVLHLRFSQGIALRRLQALLAEVFGTRLSEDAPANKLDRVARFCRPGLAHRRGFAEVEAFLGGWRPDYWLSDRPHPERSRRTARRWAGPPKAPKVCLA